MLFVYWFGLGKGCWLSSVKRKVTRRRSTDVIPNLIVLLCVAGAVAHASVSLTKPAPTLGGSSLPSNPFLQKAHLASMFKQYVPRIFIVQQDNVYTGGLALRPFVVYGVAFARCFFCRTFSMCNARCVSVSITSVRVIPKKRFLSIPAHWLLW